MRVVPAASRAVLVLVLLAAAAPAAPAPLDPASIERWTGLPGAMNEREGTVKVSAPRTDLAVSVGGVQLTPAAGLTSWATFAPMGTGAMVMGDLVLTEDQVNPVLSAALDNGLEVTALHNHFLGETPRVMFMHIAGSGALEPLATAVGKVFARLREPGAPLPAADLSPAQTRLDTERIAAVLGHRGDLSAGVYKVTIGRAARMHGRPIGATMGVNTWAAFFGTDQRAAVDGDFAMLESELQPVLKALRHAGLQVVAIHQHMTGESPRVMFLHYWGVGPAAELARGVRSALDRTASR